MKYIIRLVLPLLALVVLLTSCPTVDPLKDLPQAEYEQAQKLRSRIKTLQFSPYAPEELTAGETEFTAGEATYKKDNGASKKSFDSAITNYRLVIRKAIAARSKTKEDDINGWKQKSDDLKASLSAADDYKAAEETLAKAKAAAAEDNWEDAEILYNQAAEQFYKVYAAVKAKKDKAQDKYDSTNKILDGLKGGQDAPAPVNP